MAKLRAIIAPSLLAGDWGILASECNRMLDLGADYPHMDIMDGCVPGPNRAVRRRRACGSAWGG